MRDYENAKCADRKCHYNVRPVSPVILSAAPETRRVDGKVRPEHIASLGSVVLPLTVEGRLVLWARLHQRIDKLSNRIGGETRMKLLGAIHERVPMVLIDEQLGVKRENAIDE